MSKPLVYALFLWVTVGASACRSQADAGGRELALAARELEVEQRIAVASGDSIGLEPLAKWILPDVLREVSGVALTPDGRILAHNDERGRVYVIDPRRGVVIKQFSLGEKGIVADFEAIAVSGSDIFMLTSNGNIYQLREGSSNANVPYRLHDTKLGKECEFEGLVIEPGTGAFLLACKVIGKKSQRNQILIYRWLRQANGAHSVSTISVPLADAIGSNGWKTFTPSDLTIDPETGNYVVIAGREKGLVEITPEGQVVRSFPIPGNPQQAEGVAITRDGILIIGDEGVTRPADITLYPWRRTTSGNATRPANDSAQTAEAGTVSAR